jgi:uracil-DNA glycosylase family 4
LYPLPVQCIFHAEVQNEIFAPMTTIHQLQEKIVACARCPRLVEHREAVAQRKRRMYLGWEYWGRPLPSFGDPGARLLIVGLAPAAHGGNRTGRMFTGDRSGDWVFGTLHRFGFASSPDSRHQDDGLVLKDAYITAALHCAPPANKPLREEMANCRPYLLQELELLPQVQVVVALGKIAFDTYLGTFSERGLKLPSPRPHFGHNLDQVLIDGKTLIGSYHPSQQNTQTGRLTQDMFNSVFQKARGLLS